MGTPDFALPALRALLENYDVRGVVTRRARPAGRGRRLSPSPVKRLATEAGVPVLTPRSFRRDPQAARAVLDLEPEVIVVAAFGLMLTPDLLTGPPRGAVNIHASLLPRWRGAAPVQRAIMAGDETTGVTLMLMNEGMDTGDILATKEVGIGLEDTAGELTARLAVAGAGVLLAELPGWMMGTIAGVAQDEALATLAPRIGPGEGWLDWSAEAPALQRRVRALTPRPGARTRWGDLDIKVWRGTAIEGVPGMAPGTVFVVGGVPAVACGAGGFQLDRLQPGGGRAMGGADFLRGRPGLEGARLDAAPPGGGRP